MRKVLLAVALLALSLSVNGQNKLSDKELYNVIWAMGQMYPEGFTIDINTLKQPTEGIMVSYAATQNSFDKKSIAAVVKHARAHDGLVGGWYNPENGKYYFDATRCFPGHQRQVQLRAKGLPHHIRLRYGFFDGRPVRPHAPVPLHGHEAL